jgi:hypothetical protein
MPDKKKDVKYSVQQTRILDTLLTLLNFNGNHTFLLIDLDEHQELQSSILDMAPEIRRYYPSSGCVGLHADSSCKRPYLSIIRFLLKYHGRELYSSDFSIPLGNRQYKKTKKYKIV